MKIIHLSDLHVGQGQLHQRFVRLVDHILEQHDPSEHVIAITGDLVDVMDERSLGRCVLSLTGWALIW